MNIRVDQQNDSKVAIVESSDIIIRNVQDALDLMASIKFNHDSYKIVVRQANITEDFFELKTRLAGDILQKYVNYHIKLAVVGNFKVYNSKSLKDFIYECNKGEQVFFLEDEQSAIQVLHALR
ncbi:MULTISPECIES: DUF4180 domain-containing protein [unclassified Paenibacillus]|uniref:DUF4180 domain-containing protein n=1 Tax=unclassified Paenibacillus TaxID=185978 RepID=UPI00278B2565|nr:MULTISPECIES: DUF4180 domain-containing protein [unclassified Paenibacillus]MDQ0901022.1 hypothetical protein [Paenibacillus sp. V4I7]MDQ0920477.1 hypothetical protein [Paenibacillus sp. V4I5]